jgi:hypothetical protein
MHTVHFLYGTFVKAELHFSPFSSSLALHNLKASFSFLRKLVLLLNLRRFINLASSDLLRPLLGRGEERERENKMKGDNLQMEKGDFSLSFRSADAIAEKIKVGSGDDNASLFILLLLPAVSAFLFQSQEEWKKCLFAWT